MLPINCKYSFVTVSDAIYSVLNCTYWNFIINTLHTWFKLIIIFKFISLELFLDYSPYILVGLMSREWGWSVSISISQLLYHFKVSTNTCLASLFIYRTNLSSKIYLIFGRIFETHSIYFLSLSCLWRKLMGILLYVKLHQIHLFFGFQIFFVFMKLLTWKYPSFTKGILCIKMKFQYTYIIH